MLAAHPLLVWAAQAIGLITDLPPAAAVVATVAAQAEDALTFALARVPRPSR